MIISICVNCISAFSLNMPLFWLIKMYKFLERAETKPTVGIVCPRDKIHTYVFRHCHSLLLSDTTHRGSSFIEREKNDSPFFFMSTRKRAWGKKGQQFPCKMIMISRDIHVNSGELCVRFFFSHFFNFSSFWPYFVNDTPYVSNVHLIGICNETISMTQKSVLCSFLFIGKLNSQRNFCFVSK